MLIEFRVENFRSFQDGQVLSLVAARDKTTLRRNCTTVGKLRLLKSAGIYGANASGKSNLIKAIDIMKDLVEDSAGLEPDRELPVTPFLLNGKSEKKPSVFEVVFLHDGIKYQYGFAATRKRFQKEWLIAYPKGIGRTWYERTFNEKGGDYDWKYSTFLKGDKKKLAEKTRENALFLSVGAQWNNEQLTNVYKWFKDNLRIAPPRENFGPVTAKMLLDVEKEKGVRKELYESVIESMLDADMGIRGVKVIKPEVDKDKMKFPDKMPREVQEMIMKRLLRRLLRRSSRPKVEMAHRNIETGKDVFLPLEEESDGTQRFFQLLGPFFETVALGYTVFIDELEAHLHPRLTRELIKFIQNPEYNRNGAQLIFATHDVSLLDPELFRRDQIWFTEKDKNGSTQLYSMSDYKERRPRKGEAMQKGYLAGRYGAIPILESFRISHG
jgi:AAA15 family ATPase/GTPase